MLHGGGGLKLIAALGIHSNSNSKNYALTLLGHSGYNVFLRLKHANSRSLVAHVILEWVAHQTLVSLRGVCLVPLPPQLGVPCQPGGWHLFSGQPVDRLRLALQL